MTEGIPSFFDVFNALVDGHLADISTQELKVLLCYLRRRNKDGQAWPGPDDIQSRSGIDPRNQRRARVALERRGFLRVSEQGGGRGVVTKWGLMAPETGAQATRVWAEKTGAKNDTKQGQPTAETGAPGGRNRGKKRHKTGAPDAPRRDIEGIKNRKGTPNTTADVVAVSNLIKFLRGIGFSEGDAPSVAEEATGVSVELAELVWQDVTLSNVDKPLGFFRTIIRNPNHEIFCAARVGLEEQRTEAHERWERQLAEAAEVAREMSDNLLASVRGWVVEECRRLGDVAGADGWSNSSLEFCRGSVAFQERLATWMQAPANRTACKGELAARALDRKRLAELQEAFAQIPETAVTEMVNGSARDLNDAGFLQLVVSQWREREVRERVVRQAVAETAAMDRRVAEHSESKARALAAADVRAMSDADLEALWQNIVSLKPVGHEREWWELRRNRLAEPAMRQALAGELFSIRQSQVRVA